MRALVLCSGTGSLDQAFRNLGWEVDNLDIDPKCNCTWTADVCEWQPPDKHYDCVWASPPCTEFSIALTNRPRRLDEGLRIAGRCLDIIEHYLDRNPRMAWFLENPGTGYLPKMERFKDLPCKYVTYCMYNSPQVASHPYRKLTWIATNVDVWRPARVCTRKNPCAFMVNNRHPECAQRGPSRNSKKELYGGHCTREQLYSIPQWLCLEIVKAASEYAWDF